MEEKIEKLQKQAKTSMRTMIGFCISLIAMIAVLVVYIAAWQGVGVTEENENSYMIGVIVLGIVSIVLMIFLIAFGVRTYIVCRRLSRAQTEAGYLSEKAPEAETPGEDVLEPSDDADETITKETTEDEGE